MVRVLTSSGIGTWVTNKMGFAGSAAEAVETRDTRARANEMRRFMRRVTAGIRIHGTVGEFGVVFLRAGDAPEGSALHFFR
jgi:hypothetical protein